MGREKLSENRQTVSSKIGSKKHDVAELIAELGESDLKIFEGHRERLMRLDGLDKVKDQDELNRAAYSRYLLDKRFSSSHWYPRAYKSELK